MRDTQYARELARAVHTFSAEDEARLERILVKESQQEEIRFSWWKNGNIVQRPLDLPESDLLSLIRQGIADGVFSEKFLIDLKASLSSAPAD